MGIRDIPSFFRCVIVSICADNSIETVPRGSKKAPKWRKNSASLSRYSASFIWIPVYVHQHMHIQTQSTDMCSDVNVLSHPCLHSMSSHTYIHNTGLISYVHVYPTLSIFGTAELHVTILTGHDCTLFYRSYLFGEEPCCQSCRGSSWPDQQVLPGLDQDAISHLR